MSRLSRIFTTGLVLMCAHRIDPSEGSPRLRLDAERPAFLQTSAAGDWLRPRPALTFRDGPGRSSVRIALDSTQTGPEIVGIGAALTEASAFVLASLPRNQRDSLLDACFGPQGLDLTMARTHIGSCDFSVKGRYSYAEVPGDVELAHFTLAPDSSGFEGALDPTYDLLPLLEDALRRQPRLAIVASPWTAPPWMKDNGLYFDKGRAGGRLLLEHYPTFAHYMKRYVEGYAALGVPIWAVTPLNEPGGVGGQWESMEFGPLEMRDYIRDHLGPALEPTGVRILQFDHNRDAQAIEFSRAVFKDPACAPYVTGTAVHWYSTTVSACPEVLDSIRAMAPDRLLLHTEGCIDGIGNEDNSPGGRFKGWMNDAWWWREEATDWGWYWAPPEQKPAHPRYAPVHRYARDLIDGLAHGMNGWIDWNLVLDSRGGPNHQGNLCAAPVMVEPGTHRVHLTPLFAVIAHVSRYVRPGDRVLPTRLTAPDLGPDDLHAVAVRSADGRSVTLIAFNKGPRGIAYDIQWGERHARVTIPSNALQTMRFEVP